MFPKTKGSFLGVLIARIIVYSGLSLRPLFSEYTLNSVSFRALAKKEHTLNPIRNPFTGIVPNYLSYRNLCYGSDGNTHDIIYYTITILYYTVLYSTILYYIRLQCSSPGHVKSTSSYKPLSDKAWDGFKP